MSLVIADRVRETSTTVGTGPLTLLGAVVGFQAYSAVCANGDTAWYCIAHQTAGEWEVGVGTWGTGNVLTRTTVLRSSNGDAVVSLSAGSKDVFLAQPSDLSDVPLLAALPMVQRLNITVTEAQIRTLFSAPLLVLPATPSIANVPRFISYFREAGSAYTPGSAVNLQLVMNGVAYDSQPVGDLLNGAGPYRRITEDVNGGGAPYGAYVVAKSTRDDTNKDITLITTGGNVSGGAGRLFICLFYRAWPLSELP
jgi:hypothetical protein